MFAPKLQEIRKRVGLSQGQLAEQLGIDASLISRWEKGEREPSLEQQMGMARLLGVTIDYLVNGHLQVEFKFRAKGSAKGELKKNIQQVFTDAEQQLHHIDEVYRLAGKTPKPFLLNVDLSGQQWVEAAEQIRNLLRLNSCVTFEELKQALLEYHVHVFAWKMPHQISGLSYRGNFAAVFINFCQTEERQLFTLAHECVHVICHLHSSRSDATRSGETVVSVASNRDPQEKEANRLAAELLMPTGLVQEALVEYGPRLKSPVVLESVARFFNVSRDAMFYRLAGLGFFDWSERGEYFTAYAPPEWVPQPRVTNILEQVSPSLLNLALSLYDQERISTGKLAEWFACPRLILDDFLTECEKPDQFSEAFEF